jgi:hypothetical protein
MSLKLCSLAGHEPTCTALREALCTAIGYQIPQRLHARSTFSDAKRRGYLAILSAQSWRDTFLSGFELSGKDDRIDAGTGFDPGKNRI